MSPKLQNTVVVLYPAPGMGHVVSMVELAKLILLHHPQDFSITILLATSDFWDDPSVASYLHHVSLSHPLISFLHFPPVSVRHSLLTCSRAAVSFDCINRSAPHVLRWLEEILETRTIAAFVIDLFCGSALSVGRDLKIPTYYFFTSGAACLAAYLYFPEIHRLHHESFRDLRGTVLDFPGVPPLKAVHMPEPTLDRDDPAYHDMVNFCSLLRNSDGIIVNTFDELEPNPIKTLSDGSCVPGAPTPPTYYIGPLIAEPQRRRDECLSWLNEQPSKSVVFLCFGSRGTFSVEQVKEIASGLERSGQRFLWVLKRPKNSNATGGQTQFVDDFDLDSALPEGFMERVSGKGKMVKSWAPQVAVLGHDSVGGFVTHCGWNSVLEAVVAGVPMAALPLYAEQHLNRNVMVEDMKMAVAVEQREEDGFVSEDEVERAVRELMEGDGGRELRERSRKMRERCLAAWEESGSSTTALANLVEIWNKR